MICLRGGKGATCLGLLFGGLEALRAEILLFFMKNLLFTHIMYYKADHKQVLCFQRGLLQKLECAGTLPSKDRDSNCSLKVIVFQKGPQQPVKCVSTPAFKCHWRGLKETVMCKHLAFTGAPNSNYNVKFHAFKEAPTAFVMCKYLTFKRAPNSNCNV